MTLLRTACLGGLGRYREMAGKYGFTCEVGFGWSWLLFDEMFRQDHAPSYRAGDDTKDFRSLPRGLRGSAGGTDVAVLLHFHSNTASCFSFPLAWIVLVVTGRDGSSGLAALVPVGRSGLRTFCRFD